MTSLRRESLMNALPYARRYARALTGSQAAGDSLVADSVRELMEAEAESEDPRIELYAIVTRRFDASESATAKSTESATAKSTAGLSMKQRQLLLLTALEDVELADAAVIVALPTDAAEKILAEAHQWLRAAAATDVLIIEDEPIIAMDIEELVQGCGHRVVGVATTEQDAVEMASERRPGLILADINLGVGGDGASAVARIMEHHHAPVIFVTAYPERLLTGDAVEPAFVITKPFEPLTLAIATYQAVTGGVPLD